MLNELNSSITLLEYYLSWLIKAMFALIVEFELFCYS